MLHSFQKPFIIISFYSLNIAHFFWIHCFSMTIDAIFWIHLNNAYANFPSKFLFVCSFVFEISVLHTRRVGMCSDNLEVLELGGRVVAAQQAKASLFKCPVNWKEGIGSVESSCLHTLTGKASTYIMHAYTIIKLTQKMGVWLDGLAYKHSCISPYLWKILNSWSLNILFQTLR